ncbi:MAG TPA: cell division protein ZapE [Gammaproteobacteria bacterium]|nr:cell division protein ZapE [Gammaproteobacteria bacterium]
MTQHVTDARCHSLRERHARALEEGFAPDPAQQRAVDYLQGLIDALATPLDGAGLMGRLLRRPPPSRPRGLYLWGAPGRGKTWLMDAFHEALPFDRKRRVHFHRFMLDVHQRLQRMPRTTDPLPIVARQLAHDVRVLCLDEFHVTDVADAMLLGGLLEALFGMGVVLVATSNMEPGRLYHEGLQRERFLPAIDLIRRHTEVMELDGTRDYRLELAPARSSLLLSGDTVEAQAWLQRRLQRLAPGLPDFDLPLEIGGRPFRARGRAGGVVWFDFAELCLAPRSAQDYLALARDYHTLLLEAVPVLDAGLDEGARRFMHLVDALYDCRVNLVMTAAAAPRDLYTGRRLAEGFARTASRLIEMTSQHYLLQPHRPG